MENFNLNEMQQLRLLLAKESNFDLNKAEKIYNFIIGELPTKSNITTNPDGIYFILSSSNMIHESFATSTDKQDSIAVGIKMGNKFANVVMFDSAAGEKISLYQNNKVPCGLKPFFRQTVIEATSDWDGFNNTNYKQNSLNSEINLTKNRYIPSLAQLHLILININDVNAALIEANGEPMKDDWYWSSTERNNTNAWCVDFNSGNINNYNKNTKNIVRLSINCNFNDKNFKYAKTI